MARKVMLVWMLLTVMLIGSIFPIGAIAAQPGDIMPLYDYATITAAELSFSGTTAQCTGIVRTNTTASSISMSLMLQQKNGSSWNTVASWSDSVIGGNLLDMYESRTVSSGTYRVKASITICMPDGDYEYITQYSNEVTK